MTVRAPKWAATRVAFADDDAPLAWFWALGRSQIHYAGEIHDWDANWNKWCGSLVEYLDTFAPAALSQHDRGSEPWGIVRSARILTKADAEAIGIVQPHDEALYLGVELNEAGKALDATGALVYGSVGLSYDWQDETGRTWPVALKEFSRVGVPHLKTGHVPRPKLRDIQLGDPMDLETLAKLVEALKAQVEALAADVAKLKPAEKVETETEVETADAPDEKVEEKATVEAAMAEIAELRKSLQASEQRRRSEAGQRAIERVDAERVIPPSIKPRLQALLASDSKTDAAFAADLIESFAKRPETSERVALPGVGFSEQVDPDAQVRNIIAAEKAAGRNISYSDALARVKRG